MDFSKKWCLGVAGDFAVVKVEALVEGLVEVAANLVRDVAVELLGVRQQVQGVTQDCRPYR
ncbi:hypothetical protein [Mycobacteroides sp. LB1]|uniref:hypothetical protein n=1 Tax=Mycobacteroides sp. LB1 TaxID=2750814 RepID=UPI0015DDEB7E|nr:hypothetical protein [Mycobacteroides sp. LB1]